MTCQISRPSESPSAGSEPLSRPLLLPEGWHGLMDNVCRRVTHTATLHLLTATVPPAWLGPPNSFVSWRSPLHLLRTWMCLQLKVVKSLLA